MACDASKVLHSLQERALETGDRRELAATLVTTVKSALPRASRVSLWWREGDRLALGPHDGPPRSISEVAVGDGLLGTAVEAERDRVIPDLQEIEEPLFTSTDARSRIVIVVRSMGGVIGALDLEAAEVDAFGEVDRCILRAVADSFGGLVAAAPPASDTDAAP